MSNGTQRMTARELADLGGLANLRSSANGNPLRGIAEAAIAKAAAAHSERKAAKEGYGKSEASQKPLKRKNGVSGESLRIEIRSGAVEREVQSAICALLDAYRIPYAVTDAAEVYNRRGQRIQRLTPGWPDITACDRGRFIGIEVKRAVGGQLRYEQAVTLDRLDKAGALVVVARSIDAVIALLDSGKTSDTTRAEIAKAMKRGMKLRK